MDINDRYSSTGLHYVSSHRNKTYVCRHIRTTLGSLILPPLDPGPPLLPGPTFRPDPLPPLLELGVFSV